MKYRQLGKTDLAVSEIGFGGWTLGTDWWGKITEEQSVRLLFHAYENGINFIDTSDRYGCGYGETIIAKALKARRHDLIFSTKFGYDIYAPRLDPFDESISQNWSSDFIRYACEQSLRRLGTDYIDLYQLDNPPLETIEKDEVFGVLDELVAEGKIRYYGLALGSRVDNFEVGQISIEERDIASIQFVYNLKEQQPARNLFPIIETKNRGVLTRLADSPKMFDELSPKAGQFDGENPPLDEDDFARSKNERFAQLNFLSDHLEITLRQASAKFALSGSGVASVLPNITSTDQIDELAKASDIDCMPDDLILRIYQAFDERFGSTT